MSARELRREIDVLKSRARVRTSARRRERLLPRPDLLRRVESAECAAERIAETLRALADSMPELQSYRRLEQDGWVVGLAGTERAVTGGDGLRLARSRLEVCITTDKRTGALRLVCRRTVLDHELDVLSHEALLPSALALDGWVENACLGFAAALLARRAMRWCEQVPA